MILENWKGYNPPGLYSIRRFIAQDLCISACDFMEPDYCKIINFHYLFTAITLTGNPFTCSVSGNIRTSVAFKIAVQLVHDAGEI